MGKVVLDYTTINVFPAYLLNYNKYECNQDFCGKIPNKYSHFVEMQLPNPKQAHHEDPTTSHYCLQGFQRYENLADQNFFEEVNQKKITCVQAVCSS